MWQYTLLIGARSKNQEQKAMPWQPMSMKTPPPERDTSQNQGA